MPTPVQNTFTFVKVIRRKLYVLFPVSGVRRHRNHEINAVTCVTLPNVGRLDVSRPAAWIHSDLAATQHPTALQNVRLRQLSRARSCIISLTHRRRRPASTERLSTLCEARRGSLFPLADAHARRGSRPSYIRTVRYCQSVRPSVGPGTRLALLPVPAPSRSPTAATRRR